MEVGEIGYGAWGVGGTQWLGGTDEESLAALRTALETPMENLKEIPRAVLQWHLNHARR